jgi:hypothetical protein
VAEVLTSEERVRIHERIQEATGLIGQAEDDLPWEHPDKQHLKDLGKQVWEIGYKILGDTKYSQVDELATVIADLDEEQPFLSGAIDDVDLADASPRRVAERILERLHGRGAADG